MRTMSRASPIARNAVGARCRRALVLAATIAVVAGTPSQVFGQAHSDAWKFSVSLGGYAQGNRGAVRSWLKHNGFGAPDPRHCGFDILLNAVCDPAVIYPQVSNSDLLGWTFDIGRTVTEHVSIDVFAASEQAGTIIGRCDDLATPKDPRCTSRFMTVDFGGGSIAALGGVTAGHVHVGAGPAMLFANWDMNPAHLAGLWLDATYDIGGSPLFAHAQYRYYQSTSFAPSQHFTAFHPSTLYLGLGLSVTVDDSRR